MSFSLHLIVVYCCSHSQASQADPVAEEIPSPQIEPVQEFPGRVPCSDSLYFKKQVGKALRWHGFCFVACVTSVSPFFFFKHRIMCDMEDNRAPVSQHSLQNRINYWSTHLFISISLCFIGDLFVRHLGTDYLSNPYLEFVAVRKMNGVTYRA